MKNITCLSIWICSLLTLSSLSAQVGIGTITPRGALEISSSTNGFLPPQVQLTSTNTAAPVVNPNTPDAVAAGTIVYNIASAGVAPTNVTPGYYFWNGTDWIKFSAGNTAVETEDDLRVTIDKGSNSAQLGSLTDIAGPEIWFFRNGAGVEAMSFTLQLPHNWKAGTTIYPHLHWVPRSSASGNVQWNLDYSWADLNTITPATFPAITTSSNIATGPFVKNQHLLTDLTPGNVGISGAGKNYSSVLICRIWRDSGLPSDTYGSDAGGLSMDFHITIVNPFVEYP